MNSSFKVDYFGSGIYIIQAPLMREGIYLVEGEKNDLLIDTSMGAYSLKEAIAPYLKHPLLVLDTHGHPDHAGGNGEFDKVYLHQADLKLFLESCQVSYRFSDLQKQFGKEADKLKDVMVPFKNNVIPLNDCDVIDLGNRRLSVIWTPGHTHGSVCLYDEKAEVLFTGDTVTEAGQWIYLPVSTSLKTYDESLKKLLQMKLKIRYLMPGHTPAPIDPLMIEKKEKLARDILAHKVVGKLFKTFAGTGFEAEEDGAVIIYDPLRLN
jgi:hydroxyacylglutathione hydrolase